MAISPAQWLRIIAFILALLAKGLPKSSAVSQAAAHFNVSESDIWNHGGF